MYRLCVVCEHSQRVTIDEACVVAANCAALPMRSAYPRVPCARIVTSTWRASPEPGAHRQRFAERLPKRP